MSNPNIPNYGENKYTPTAWGKGPELMDIELPSGQICQAQKLEMEDIIRLNIVNELDTFTGIFSDSEEESTEETELESIKRLSSGGNFDRVSVTINAVLVDSVKQPVVHPIPKDPVTGLDIPKENRPRGPIYVDMIGFMDKMFIFGKVFDGLSSMADFRDEPDDGVGAVEAEPVHAADPSPTGGVL